ncbi:MAG: OadG family protein [Desulfobacterales bacterium]|nr:OadG family protein [Desulfobacterales bacterium]
MGIANIAANNGWAMAFLGASIVMSGLIILSLAISQIHKLVDFWEKRKKKEAEAAVAAPAPIVAEEPAQVEMAACPINLDELVALYQPLSEPLGSPFELKDLYRLAGESNLPHPHITIRCFREAGLLMMAEEGLFIWKD